MTFKDRMDLLVNCRMLEQRSQDDRTRAEAGAVRQGVIAMATEGDKLRSLLRRTMRVRGDHKGLCAEPRSPYRCAKDSPLRCLGCRLEDEILDALDGSGAAQKRP